MTVAAHLAIYGGKIAELKNTLPYDGRRVILSEKRGDWRYTGLHGVCMHINDSHMVLRVEHDPENYWPAGAEVLVELYGPPDNCTRPVFQEIK